jgi:acyl carrier protein
MPATLAEEDLLPRVKKTIQDVLKVNEFAIQPQSLFKEDLGADSMDRISLLMALEEEFDTIIPDEDAEKLARVSDVMEYIRMTLANGIR